MDDRLLTWFQRLDPRRLADEANQGFVGLAHFLDRLISLQQPSGREAPCRSGNPRWPHGVSSIEKRFHAALVERIERILRRSASAGRAAAHWRRGAGDSSIDDGTAQLMIRELFHRDAGHRLSAARWIRKFGFGEAIPALEGALSIEESEEVREEIARGLREMRSVKP